MPVRQLIRLSVGQPQNFSRLTMRIRKLNFGGIFGGLVCAAAAAAILFLLSKNGAAPLRAVRLVILAALGGAAIGSWIWRLALPADQPKDRF
jgi:hypothetical protein